MGNLRNNEKKVEIPLNKVLLIQKIWRQKRKIKKLFIKNKITLTTSSNNSLPGMEIEYFDPTSLLSSESQKTENFLGEFSLLKNKNIKLLENSNLINVKRLYNNNTIYIGTLNKISFLKEGIGTLYNINEGSKYIGEFLNDKFNGLGRIIFNDGSYYEGVFENNFQNGYGKFQYENYSYIGNWLNNKKNGFGEENFDDGSYYKGYFINDFKKGYGIFKYVNGKIIEGFFNKENKVNGITKMKFEDEGKFSIGLWENGIMNGINFYFWNNNQKYFGEYINFIKNGFGIFFYDDKTIYEGFWINGKQHGYGIIRDLDNEDNLLNYNLYFFRFGKEITQIKDSDYLFNEKCQIIENKVLELKNFSQKYFNIENIFSSQFNIDLKLFNLENLYH